QESSGASAESISVSPARTRSARGRRVHHRQQFEDEGNLGTDFQGCTHADDGFDPRRERDGERTGGASHPSQQHAQQSPAGDAELHGIVSRTAGKRTLRLPERRFYGSL